VPLLEQPARQSLLCRSMFLLTYGTPMATCVQTLHVGVGRANRVRVVLHKLLGEQVSDRLTPLPIPGAQVSELPDPSPTHDTDSPAFSIHPLTGWQKAS
jgi:hypothetical protein